MNDDRQDLSALREESAPKVVDAAFGRFRKRLLLGALVLSVLVGSIAFLIGRSQSDEEMLDQVVGEDHGPFHRMRSRSLEVRNGRFTHISIPRVGLA